jgi:hypothetical protein
MATQAGSELLAGWWTACTAGIVAATLLSSCAPRSDTNEVTAHSHASDLYVDIDHDIVTVRAHDVPLHTVIEKLADHGGLLVSTQDRLDQRVTVELHSLTLRAALQELLRGISFVLVDPPQNGLATLWILADGQSQNGIHEHARREEQKNFDALGAALENHDSNTRIDEVSALRDHVDDAQAATMLESLALNDGDPSVRKAAIGALENIEAENSIRILAIALTDHEASVRATAVDALGEIGGDNALRLLESALADESDIVREAAAERLLQPPSSNTQ